ncbi:hypothetical protein BTO04_00070 [Polaribacter sp. SA4-10]|uniref:hypothetical protein n=1 Tax=Polaribacter sp. SA4-10 TaxID=754397 RepID=UPI000B3CFABE|nr:hypothetical protein [Polaribacter sp. SA4-10]ARV05184.1 hypothetical protein BTO04_00070 [Polaribacter sp. SA4-10]
MKKKLLLLSVLMLSSCAIIFPKVFQRKPANFSLENLWFNTQLDYNNSSRYLLNTTQLNYNALNSDGYNEHLLNFFSKKVGHNTLTRENYKTTDHKVIFPFTIEYDLTKENIELLQKTTDLDYIILSKILIPNQINNNPKYESLKYRSGLLAGSVVFLKIFDIKNHNVLIDMRCKSAVYDKENFNFDTNSYEKDTKISTYKSEEQLVKKCFKRIFSRIE